MTAMTATPGLLDPYNVSRTHDLFRRDFPEVERQIPVLQMAPFLQASQPPPSFVQPGMPLESRWWFVSEDRSGVIQVQENLVARNWRRLAPPPEVAVPYPGFDAIFASYRDVIATIEADCAARSEKMPEPSVCELLYENLIPLEDSDGNKVRMSDVIAPITFDTPSPRAAFNMVWVEPLAPDETPLDPQVLVTIAHVMAQSPPEGQQRLYAKLAFGARSAVSGWAEAFSFIERSHARFRTRLLELTTEQGRATWGSA
jgi:uncharacterized protein (TIGR04255 family)